MKLSGSILMIHPEEYARVIRIAVQRGYIAGQQDTMRSFGRSWQWYTSLPDWHWPGLLVSGAILVGFVCS